MGCASSSTPMVATTGSEMLKTATHAVGDAKQAAEGAIEDVTATLGKTIDNAKETVGQTVTSLTNELGTVVKQQTEALDETKNKILDKLHLGGGGNGDDGTQVGAPVTNVNGNQSASRAATPAHDADSLKTSTPEPEIEQALANTIVDEEDSPPTPQPTLAELAHLTAEVATATQMTSTSSDKDATTKVTALPTHEFVPAPAPVEGDAVASSEAVPVKSMDLAIEQQPRPGTTEWEKFADMMATSRKFNPYEAFSQNVNQFSVYQDYTHSHDSSEPKYDGSFSDLNTLTSLSQSSLSSPHFTRARLLSQTQQPTIVPPLVPAVVSPIMAVSAVPSAIVATVGAKRYPREFASLVACEQPASVMRLGSKPPIGVATGGRTFDYNPNRERITLPMVMQRVGSPVHGSRIVSKHADSGSNTLPDICSKDGSIVAGTPIKLGTLSRTSHSSSTSSGVVIKSNLTTPSTLSPERTLPAIVSIPEHLNAINEPLLLTSTPVIGRSRSRTRRTSNTSSFLSSPRASPFSVRKEYDNKENKLAVPFVADLSSVMPKRTALSPSPYKIRERCEVCYNKYVIK